MKSAAPYIREKLVTVLNDTVTYEGAAVPAYTGQGEVRDYQILIRDPRQTDISTRDSFNGRWEVEIEIVSEQTTNLTRHIDAIGAGVMNLMKPAPKTSSLTGNHEFEIAAVKMEGFRYLDEQSGEGTFINRLILRYTFLTTQISNT